MESLRALTKDLSEELLRLESNPDPEVSEGATSASNDISFRLHQLQSTLETSARILQRQGSRVLGRSLPEEDRRRATFYNNLEILAHQPYVEGSTSAEMLAEEMLDELASHQPGRRML